jgi:diguanylate cyclase (GGDEF)-like protein
MERWGGLSRAGLGGLACLTAAYLVIPNGPIRDIWYDGVGVLCMAYALLALRRRRPAQMSGWVLVAVGFAGWVVGDVEYSIEQGVWHLQSYPLPSDAVYLASYVSLGLGLMIVVRGRQSHLDPSVVLDAAIIATGCAVLVGVFLIDPIAKDSTLSLFGKLVSSAYPVADVMLAGLLVRLWRSPASMSPAFRLLSSALAFNLLGDIVWNVSVLTTGSMNASAWNNLCWLASYLLVAAACVAPPSTRWHPARSGREPTRARTQMFALTGGLLLPAAALLLNGAAGGPVRWLLIGSGSVVLSVLVLARMARLLKVVQVQAIQLSALARSDGLTGAPNRRTWDHELSRACQRARDTDELLCVALLDLDHFKRYNDANGHQAGDLLLRQAVAAWGDLLDDGDLLARYGGEEFAVLLPGYTPAEAAARLDLLRAVTPERQTFSAGVALWDSTTEPAEAVRAADEALYDAKRSGRNRVCLAGSLATARLPVPVVVLQPIVDLRSGAMVAMEALSRFEGEDPQDVFERAEADGVGPELEAAAICAALLCRPEHLVITLNVSLAALVHPSIVAALPDDLRGITLEITEHSDVWADPTLEAALAGLRRRGARVAVDDWGRGFSNMDRLLRLRPEVVKLDMSLVHALSSDYHRAMVRSVTAWADEVGATVCAEGVETETQRRTLLTLGVHTAQGYLFGGPAPPGTYTAIGMSVDDLVG